MKKQLLLLTVLMILLTMSVIAETGFQIVELRQISRFEKPFVIIADKSTYKQGETALITSGQNINAMCDGLSVNIYLKDVNGNTKATDSRNIGKAGYFSAQVTTLIDIKTSYLGNMVVEDEWLCRVGSTTTILGADGYIDSNIKPSKVGFLVIEQSSTPPAPSCSKSCDGGFELVNKNSPDCYCQPGWTPNDGVCEIGEPIVTEDCENGTIPGGNKTPWFLIIGGVVVLIGIGVIFIKK